MSKYDPFPRIRFAGVNSLYAGSVHTSRVMSEISEEFESLPRAYQFLKGAPFKELSIVLNHAPSLFVVPNCSRIRKNGELQVILDLDGVDLHGLEREQVKEYVRKAISECLVFVAEKYALTVPEKLRRVAEKNLKYYVRKELPERQFSKTGVDVLISRVSAQQQIPLERVAVTSSAIVESENAGMLEAVQSIREYDVLRFGGDVDNLSALIIEALQKLPVPEGSYLLVRRENAEPTILPLLASTKYSRQIPSAVEIESEIETALQAKELEQISEPSTSLDVYIEFESEPFGTHEEQALCEKVDMTLTSIVEEQGIGEFHSNEYGDGFFWLRLSGEPNALFNATESAIRNLCPGGKTRVILVFDDEHEEIDEIQI